MAIGKDPVVGDYYFNANGSDVHVWDGDKWLKYSGKQQYVTSVDPSDIATLPTTTSVVYTDYHESTQRDFMVDDNGYLKFKPKQKPSEISDEELTEFGRGFA